MATTLQHKTIPGPRSLNPLKATLAFRSHPLQYLTELQKSYGNIVHFNLIAWPVVFLSHPDYTRRILQDNHLNYDKDARLYQILRPLLGNGLVIAVGGDAWLRQRRLVQPAFHRQRIAALGTLMTDATNTMLQQWDSKARERQVFDIAEDMVHLTLQIVSKSLFNIDVSDKSNALAQATLQANVFLVDYISMPFPPLSVKTARNRRYWSAIETIDTFVYEIIHNRQKHKVDVGDLLSIMLDSVDEDGQGMDEKQLRDEIMTLLLAGHETSAGALAWTWYLLAKHPEVQERLHAELDQVLAGRTPTVADFPQLQYTRMVVEEALRLYPPTWLLMRRAIQDDEIGGYRIRSNTSVVWSNYLSHRLPEFWEKPEEFYPDHFSQELSAKRPRHVYTPFGGGPRVCLGNNFALTEMQLIVATAAQQYRVSLAPEFRVKVEPLMTLRPKDGVLVSIEHR